MLKLNKANERALTPEAAAKLKRDIEKIFYVQMANDLVANDKVNAARIVFNELERSKIPIEDSDQIVFLKIVSSQGLLDEFKQVLETIMERH